MHTHTHATYTYHPLTPCAHTSQVIDDPGGSKLLLVMEYMEGGPVLTRESLEKRDKLPEPLALVYFRDMIKVTFRVQCQQQQHCWVGLGCGQAGSRGQESIFTS